MAEACGILIGSPVTSAKALTTSLGLPCSKDLCLLTDVGVGSVRALMFMSSISQAVLANYL